jgi:hypothetical protein
LSSYDILAQFINELPATDPGLISGGPVYSTSTLSGEWDLGILDQFDIAAGASGTQSLDVTVGEVPEPTTFALFGAGLLGCALFVGRRRSSKKI